MWVFLVRLVEIILMMRNRLRQPIAITECNIMLFVPIIRIACLFLYFIVRFEGRDCIVSPHSTIQKRKTPHTTRNLRIETPSKRDGYRIQFMKKATSCLAYCSVFSLKTVVNNDKRTFYFRSPEKTPTNQVKTQKIITFLSSTFSFTINRH